MDKQLCRLCLANTAIDCSHVIPKFVYRAIKADSPTGFFRNPHDPNRRFQDGDKLPLLCSECEQRFGTAEQKFQQYAFSPFHTSDKDEFSYGPWLHYFMTSIAWRTLVLDLPGFEADAKNPKSAVRILQTEAERMRTYLLGCDNLASGLRNHAIVLTEGHSGSVELAAVRPNVKIRRSVFGYSIIDRKNEYSGIIHNLAGFMCFYIVKGNPRDKWQGTKVNPSGGEIRQPQQVDSWLVGELLSCIVESGKKLSSMSQSQKAKIDAGVRENPKAKGLRFSKADAEFLTSD